LVLLGRDFPPAPRRIRHGIFLCSVLVYACSLLLPAILFDHDPPEIGLTLLVGGWWGFIFLQFAWLANPLYFLAAIICFVENRGPVKRPIFGVVPLLIVATILALTSFHAREWWPNEAESIPITGLGPGFYVWISSFLILMVGCFVTDGRDKGGAAQRTGTH